MTFQAAISKARRHPGIEGIEAAGGYSEGIFLYARDGWRFMHNDTISYCVYTADDVMLALYDLQRESSYSE